MLAKNQWGRRFLGLIGMFLDSFTLVYLPLLLKEAFDLLANPAQFSDLTARLNRVVLLLFAVAFLRSIGIYMGSYFQEGTGAYIGHDVKQLLFRKLLRTPFAFFDRTKTGDLMSVMTRDVDAVRDGTGWVIMLVIVNAITAVGILVAMFRLDVLFSFIVLSVFPLLAALAIFYSKRVGPLYRTVHDQSGRLHTVAQENVSGIRVVKAFVRHKEEEAKFKKQNRDLYRTSLRIAFLSSIVHPSMDFLGGAASLIALGIGGYFVISGRMTFGTLIAFTNFADNLIWPIRQIGWLTEMVQRATAGAKRIFEILDSKESLPQPENAVDKEIEGEIVFDNVTFKYENGEEALKDFSLHIKPGEKVCLLGITGSGKTTAASLIPRFYDVTSGSIRIDGYDVREWDLNSLRRQIGFVFQDNFLFSTTLRDNLTMGRQDITEEQLMEAVQTAQAAEFIEALPERFETIVGERGIGLSGGERQRIAIARALLRDPKILILDDSTSSLDMRTEAKLEKAMQKLMAGRTVVIIAQRVSTAKTADKIIVLDSGRIVEEGTHEELLKKNGIYADLARIQAMNQTLISEEEVSTLNVQEVRSRG